MGQTLSDCSSKRSKCNNQNNTNLFGGKRQRFLQAPQLIQMDLTNSDLYIRRKKIRHKKRRRRH